MQTQLLIAGRLIAGGGEAEQVLDAASGAVIATVAAASAQQVEEAVTAAETAFLGWARTAPKDRAALLLRVAEHLEAEAAAYAALENRATPASRSPRRSATSCRRSPTCSATSPSGVCRAPSGLAAGEYLSGHTSMIRRDPVGVVASIAPWNYPLMMAAWKIAPRRSPPATTLILKPSGADPAHDPEARRLLRRGPAPGVVNIICGRGEPVGRPAHEPPARAHGLAHRFGGHREQKILAAAADNLKRTHLEPRRARPPVIVFDDADPGGRW